MTDYDGFGQTSKLYCINVDPFIAGVNPYQPGELVWSVPIGGATGSSPSYLPRREGGPSVFVASIGAYNSAPGQIFAYDASQNIPTVRWIYSLPVLQGFFGGSCVATMRACGGGESQVSPRPTLLAATYAFAGNIHNSRVVALDARTGASMGIANSNRSASIPVPVSDRRFLLAGGLPAYGSAPSLRAFHFESSDCNEIDIDWDSAVTTWHDANNNNAMDPGEYLPMAGWQMHAAAARFAGKSSVLCGLQSDSALSEPALCLHKIDPQHKPDDADWITQSSPIAGGPSALAGANAYSIGIEGLVAFGPPPVRFDTEFDADVDCDDLCAWERGYGQRDVDADGDTDEQDRRALVTLVRHREGGQLTEGRFVQ